MKKQCSYRLHKVIFCFKSLKKITRPAVILIVLGNQRGKKMVYKQQNASQRVEVWAKYHILQTFVHLNS